MTLKSLVNTYLDHYNAFRTEELLEMFTDDCNFQNVTNSAGVVECTDKMQLRSVFEQSQDLFQTRKQTITNWIENGNKVAIETDYVATLACDLPNGFQKGDTIYVRGVSTFEFEDGKIKSLRDYS